MQWPANCRFAYVIPFSTSRKKIHMQRYTFQLSPRLQFILDAQGRGFAFESGSEMLERPRKSRLVFLGVPSLPQFPSTTQLSCCHRPTEPSCLPYLSFPLWTASVHSVSSTWRILSKYCCASKTQIEWRLFWVETHAPLVIRAILLLFAFIQLLVLSTLRLIF